MSDPQRPGEAGWIREVLGSVLARAEEQQRDAEEHAKTCTERPCKRCHRYVCACGTLVDGEPFGRERPRCTACIGRDRQERLLKPTHDSIPPHFRWAIGATGAILRDRVQGAAELVRRGLEAPPSSGLLLLGATGSGKTSLAVAMLDAWVRQAPHERTGALFVEAGWLSRARARHKLGADEAPLVARAMSCPLLVLDDLGSEREDRDGCITDVVWTRTNQDLPMWITCGLASEAQTLEGFVEAVARRYDGGFARRIIETSKRVTLGAK